MSHGISNSNINSAAAPKLTALKSKAQTNITTVASDGFGKQALVKQDGFEKIKNLDQNTILARAEFIGQKRSAEQLLGADLYKKVRTDGAPEPAALNADQRLARLNAERELYKDKQSVTRTKFDTQV